jgi:hypothetical protein
LATPGTLFGYTESEVAGFAIVAGLAAILFFKFALIRFLVRSQKVGRTGARVLYAVFIFSVASIIAIVTLLYFWKV